MQIFVKQPCTGPTLIFHCSDETTLLDFFQWVEDKTAIPEEYYFILYNGHYLPKSTDGQRTATFAQVGIKNESTIQLCGRLSVRPNAKKLNATA